MRRPIIVSVTLMINLARATPSVRRSSLLGILTSSPFSLGHAVGNRSGNAAFATLHGYQARSRKVSYDALRDVSDPNLRSASDISAVTLDDDRYADNDCTGRDADVQEISSSESYCYLIRSLDLDHPFKTYIGFTTNPERRLRQHNGELVRGARRTKSGRPWKYVAIIDGFLDKVTAMQFEWAWQHVDRSKVFRAAVGSDILARKMKRRRGAVARLEDLSVLLHDCSPFNTLPLKFHYLDEKYHDYFRNSAVEGNCLNLTLCSQDDKILTTRGAMEGRIPALNSINQVIRSTFSPFGRDSFTMNVFGKSRRLINTITSNSLLRLGERSQSHWALSARSASNIQDSILDENLGADDLEQVVKTPSKFKPYPFTVSKMLPLIQYL